MRFDGTPAAHRLHALGFHVFPLDHPDHPECIGLHGPDNPCDGWRGKHPLVRWSVWAVHPTPQMIDMKWGEYGGTANIGISCGPTGLVVLDEDEAGALDRWCESRGITLPPTYEVTTGRGRHLYFAWDHKTQGHIGNAEKAFKGYKINVRGDGGYAVGEGSEHASGAIYTGNGLPVAPLPTQVAEILLTAPGPEANADNDSASSFLNNEGNPNTTKIPMGARHTALVRYAGRLRSKGMDYQEALVLFLQRWLLCEQPAGQIPEATFHSTECPYPVTWDEAVAKLDDVYRRYEAGEGDDDGAANRSTTERSIEWLRLADINDAAPQWAWEHDGYGRIQNSTLTLFAGRPGSGKSSAARYFVAGYSNGTIDGCWKDQPQSSVYIAAEETATYVLKPALRALGADMNRIYAPKVKTAKGDYVSLLAEDDERELTAFMVKHKIRIIVVDPVMSTFKSKVDINRSNEMREALAPWVRIAEAVDGIVIGIVHFTKGTTGDVVAAINGSSAFGEVARCVFGFAKDNTDGLRVFSQAKNSCGREDLSMEYVIADEKVTVSTGEEVLVGKFVLGDESDLRVEDLMTPHKGKRPLSPAMEAVLDYVNGQAGNVTPMQVHLAGLAKSNKLAAQMLHRLFKRGEILNPFQGQYSKLPDTDKAKTNGRAKAKAKPTGKAKQKAADPDEGLWEEETK